MSWSNTRAAMDAKTLVDYAKSLDCIHCGLCLNTCPTYRLTGAESSSPRGRIHLMRAVYEGQLEPDEHFREEMEFCLLCRNCESVCPSGVRFGAMMEFTRGAIAQELPRPLTTRIACWFGFRVLLPHRTAMRAFVAIGRFAQRAGLLRMIAPMLGARGRALLAAPSIPRRSERRRLPATTPPANDRRGSVAVLEGCVMPELYGRVNRATIGVLAKAGFESRCPREHVCCGSLHAHNGDLAGARRLARATIEAFETLRDTSREPLEIVVNSAGCSSHMKEYGHLLRDDAAWRERAGRFSARVRDFTEFLASDRARGGLARSLSKTAVDASFNPVTYDDPCHLCHGQGIRKPPRQLLDLVPGLERVEMEDSELCCGSAGIYALVRPADSAAVFEPKVRALVESGARTLVTANPGCQLQWETGLKRAGIDVRVMHIAELLNR